MGWFCLRQGESDCSFQLPEPGRPQNWGGDRCSFPETDRSARGTVRDYRAVNFYISSIHQLDAAAVISGISGNGALRDDSGFRFADSDRTAAVE